MRCFVIPKKQLTGRLDVLYHLTLLRESAESCFTTYRLDALVDTYTGGTPSKDNPTYWNGEIPWVSPKDFKNFYIDNTEDYITDLGLKESSTKLAAEYSVIVVVRSGILQHTLPVAVNTKPVAFNQDVKALVPKNKQQLSSKYLGYYLSIFSKRILPLITKHSTTVQSINTNEFDGLLIPLPHKSDQDRIVVLMNHAYAEKHRLEQEAENLQNSIDGYILDQLGIELPVPDIRMCFVARFEQVKQKRLDGFYHQPEFIAIEQALKGGNSRIFTIGDLMTDISGGATPRVEGNAYSTLQDGGIPFLRVQNVTREGLKLDDVKYIKREIHEGELKRSQLKKNDLVLTITGRIGSVSVVPIGFEGNINQHSVRIALKRKIDGKKIYPDYVAAYLNTNFANRKMLRLSTGGTRPALDYSSVRRLDIPVPDPNKQEEIVDEVKKRLSKTLDLKKLALNQLNQASSEVEKILFGEVR
jgi:type I restriction enzyme S subunit